MTSTSFSELAAVSEARRGGRSLAVYQTPSVPEGWHGRDLVRIVDPIGLAVAWVSPAHAGAIVTFSARNSTDDEWTGLLRAEPDPATAATWMAAGVPLWKANEMWTMRQRDPISAVFACQDGTALVEVRCLAGELVLTATLPDARDEMTFWLPDAAEPLLRREIARNGDHREVRLSSSRENASR